MDSNFLIRRLCPVGRRHLCFFSKPLTPFWNGVHNAAAGTSILQARRSLFSSPPRELQFLEAEANKYPKTAKKQADLYEALIDYSPEKLTARFESKKYAVDNTCALLYIEALSKTNKLHKMSRLVTEHHTGHKEQGVAAEPVRGSADTPLYVVNMGTRSIFSRWLSFLVNVGIIVSIAYIFYGNQDPRMSGISLKAHKIYTNASKVTQRFSDVQGCDEAKHELIEIVEFLKTPAKFNKLGAKLPKGVLLVGPPGTGKTLMARAVAGEAGVTFIYASGSEFDELYVGVGTSRIKQMFEEAKLRAPAIIFIDEIDAVASKRNPKDPQHSRMSLNQLLVELDGFQENSGVVVLAATNFPETLDPALIRPGRFDKHVTLTLPDIQGRRNILKHYMKDVSAEKGFNIDPISRGTVGFSGADLFKLINMAKIKASVDNSRVLKMIHIEQAKDEMVLGIARKSTVLSEVDRKRTAYHEGGHAIVAHFTSDSTPIHKITIIPHGASLGMVTQIPEKDEHLYTLSQLNARLDVCMGGRVAEEVIYGPTGITTGASSDFESATSLARRMVTKFGMCPKVGNITIPNDRSEIGAELSNLVDSEVNSLLQASHTRARHILQDRRKLLDKLVMVLLDKETLTRTEFEKIIKG